jgi:hypothetical protein
MNDTSKSDNPYAGMTHLQLAQHYSALLHAMQSGVSTEQARGSDDGTPKHLRVGVNAAMSDHGALVGLLIAKGVFTDREYLEAITAGMQREVDSYRQRIADKLGVPIERITLG